MMWRIFVPLQYLFIFHPEKRKFDILLPLIMAIVLWIPLGIPEFRQDAIGSLEIISKISGFLGILTGFFIAALAAVATFGKAEMDDPMPGEPPVRLEHRDNKEKYSEDLSRRRFLSFLFGYLSFITLFCYVFGGFYIVVDKYFVSVNFPMSREYVFSLFWLLYTFIIGNIVSNTLLGLFYLTDRIHRPNKTLRKSETMTDSENPGLR